MNNVWWSVLNFLKKLFVPPEFTSLEKELLRQVSHLEGKLHRAEERYNELAERIIFPSTGPVVEQKNDVTFSVLPNLPPASQRKKQLEDLSRQRYLERADRLVRDAEEKLRNRDKENEEGSHSTDQEQIQPH